MSGEERNKKTDDIDVEKLDAVELADKYGQMVEGESSTTTKNTSVLENMDPETGDFIRPSNTLKPPGRTNDDVDDGSDEKSQKERQRKLSKQSVKELSTKELTRQVRYLTIAASVLKTF